MTAAARASGAWTCARGLNAAVGAGAAPALALEFAPERRLVCVYTSGSTGAHVACPKTAAQLLGRGRAAGAAVGPRAQNPRARNGPAPSSLRPAVRRPGPVHGRRQLRPHDAAARRDDRRAGARPPGERAGQRPRAPARGGARSRPASCRRSRAIFSSGAPLDAATAAAVTALAGIPVTEVLGSSETGGIAWRDSGGDGAWTPFPGVAVAADPDDETMLLRSPFAGWRRRRRPDPRRRSRSARATAGASSCSGAPTASSRSAAAAWRSPRSNACCARSRAWPTPRSSRSTRRRRAGTSCGRPSSRRRSRSRRCAAPCSAGSSRSRCRAASAWSPRSRARTTASW